MQGLIDLDDPVIFEAYHAFEIIQAEMRRDICFLVN